jgi:hypothetical protein
MKLIKFSVFFIILAFSIPASAQFYKYVDENGTTRFTDDINDVPVEQRDKIKSYVESESSNDVEGKDTESPPPEESQQQATIDETSDEQKPADLEDTRKNLDALKAELDAEYDKLVQEKKTLAEEKKNAISTEQIIEYNQKVDDLNKRVKAYEEKGKQYKAQVNAYNKQIMEENARNDKKESQ